MKRNILAILLAVFLLAMLPMAVLADTIDGSEIAFSEWANAGSGSWKQSTEGILSPAEVTDFTLLRLERDLGDEYTVELDVKQEDLTSGWQTIEIGFEVNAGENFTQSGFTLDLHNAGVGRVINYANAYAGAGVEGSYDNPYGGNMTYVPNTEWRHIKIQRDGSQFRISVDNDPAQTISFTNETVSGGHLVIGAVGSRMVSYKNIVITTKKTPVDSGKAPSDDWANAGTGSWKQTEDGVLYPAELTDYTLLRLEKDLGNKYTIELDVKQEDLTSGWQTIQIGFEVNAGENFTQSGLMIDLHNAGVGRVINYANAYAGAGVQGSYDNPYGGNMTYVPNTEWRHVKIQRDGNKFTVSVDNESVTFTNDDLSGGHLVIGAVGNRSVSYKNVTVKTADVTITPEAPPTGDSARLITAGILAMVGAMGAISLCARKKTEN